MYCNLYLLLILCNDFKQGVQTMNTELIIKAVNAVIEFNSAEFDFSNHKSVMSAAIEVSKHDVCCRIYWGWDGKAYLESYNEYSISDAALQQFIDKLQELSQ